MNGSFSLRAAMRSVRVRRAAATLVGLACVFGTGLSAHAQNPNDTVLVPTPYSWPSFHNGGTTPTAVNSGNFTSGFNPNVNLLAAQLQGTPSGLLTNGQFDQIGSYVLGNFDPNTPPGLLATLNPNNFRDVAPFSQNFILSWSSPYTFTTPQVANTAELSVDDNDGAPYFAHTGGWSAALQDGTAINQEYIRVAAAPTATANESAVWTLPGGATPTALPAGFYTVTVHIPDTAGVPADTTTTATTPTELRITDARYVVRDTTTNTVLADTRISQTDANASQYLAGPFFINAGDVVTVSMDNSTAGATAGRYVVADTVSLQPGFGASVQSSPAAVNATDYPEIQNALYYGVAGRAVAGSTPSTPDPNPYGNVTPVVDPRTGSTAYDANHRIRSLVYYGRQETIVLQDNTGSLVNAAGQPVTVPVAEQVGAIYCVDGQNGEVVWRYQTPSILSSNNGVLVLDKAGNPIQSQPSREVFSTPVVARINVQVPRYSAAPAYTRTFVKTTKLVVIVGDNNGMVYCLDAVGNRDGTSNSDAVSASNQPIYNPQAGIAAGLAFNPTGVQDTTPKAHVGNTVAYWIYRPDPAAASIRKPTIGKVDLTSNLPVPGSFGAASPVVYVNPDVAASPNAIGTTSGTSGEVNQALTTNATVYVGNSNGVLYALDTFGGIPSASETYNLSRFIDDPTAPDFDPAKNPNGTTFFPATGAAQTPTTEINWWLPLNGAKTSDTATVITAGGYESIVSTPAIYAVTPPTSLTGPTTFDPNGTRYIYVTSSDDTNNEGRLYAVKTSGFGPTGEKTPTAIGSTTNLVPGSVDYNEKAVSLWEFPNRYVRTGSTVEGQDKIREALGSITGSPVVFTDPHGTSTRPNSYNNSQPITRVYFAACSGLEYGDTERPSVDETGRIWAVEATTGVTAWAYPDALNPNVTTPPTTIGGVGYSNANPPPDPLGAFRFATPAIGMVQFPATIVASNATGTPYTHADGNIQAGFTSNGATGPIIPMLYVGSAGNGTGSQGPRLYGLDLDGRTDDERTIFEDTSGGTTTLGVVSPSGNFETSPALVVNPTNTSVAPATGQGNGGALFLASGTTLYQFSATPVTSRDPASVQPNFNPQPILNGVGALTSPSVSAYVDTDLVTTDPAATPIVRDWVYYGDSGQGIARGITPITFGGGGDNGVLPGIVPTDPISLNTVVPQFPVYTYIFDGSTNHPGTSQDMTKANQIGQTLPLFEWGQNVYIRIGNVVPPNTGDVTNNLDDATHRIYDPDDPTIFLTNGGPVTIQVSDVDLGNNQAIQTDSGQVPTAVLTNLNPVGGAIPNGFVRRTDASTNGYFAGHPNERLGAAFTFTDPISGVQTPYDENGWIAAYTYAIRDGSARRNTPGATRRVVTATQVVQAYDNTDPTKPVFKQSVTLQTTITQGGEYTQAVGTNGRPTAIKPIFPVDQPTFAILNPLAVRGGGVPLFDSINTPSVGAKPIGNDIGPFFGVSSTGITAADLPALANGNRYPSRVVDVPLNGVTTVNNRARRNYQRGVAVTSVGDINHGSTGSNADTKPSLNPPTGVAPTGLSSTKFGQYSLNIADRSALGLVGLTLRSVTIDAATMRWTDNSGNEGPGAMVNPLPWEAVPHGAGAGSNTSLDYPDIGSSAMQMTLLTQTINGVGGDITNQAAIPDPAAVTQGSTSVEARTIQADPVQLQVTVPKYQPANLQIYDAGVNSAGPPARIGPEALDSTHDDFPMGYVAQQRVFVDSNHNGKWDDGEAYRTFGTFGGVPVSMTTTIETPTVDLGKLPESLGLQTENYPALGTFMPYPTAAQYGVNSQNPGYVQFFKPLTVFNRGNTNLLNVHFDQKVDGSQPAGAGNPPTANNPGFGALPLLGDFLDASATIPAIDLNNLTGPPGTLPGGVNALPYLLRTSLDSDLVAAYGRNPGLLNNAPYNALGASFHKPRVGDASPSVLTVPDVPHDNDPTQAAAAAQAGNFNLATTSLAYATASGLAVPVITGNTLTSGPLAAAPPYVALAVPQGTPVGTYAQSLRLFEGIDPNGYHAIYPSPGPGKPVSDAYVPLLPPQYNGTIINPTLGNPAGGGSPNVNSKDLYGNLVDTWIVPNGVTTQPYSTPTTVKATVIESRITNGNSKGDLPQVDNAPTNSVGNPAVVTSSANFQPSAFRDPATGNVSLYWTSSRSNPYELVGANLPFNVVGTGGYFGAANAANWWNAVNPNVLTNGVNTAINVTTPVNNKAYGFVTNVLGGTGASSQNRLMCYSVNVASGAVSPTGSPVTANPSQPFYGVHGLFAAGFKDAYPASTTPINNDLWAFWYGGARGRSAIYFSTAASSDVDSGVPTAFGPTAVLPIPAGLVSVSDPTAVLSFAPDPTSATSAPVPVIEVTYTGISADGNADIYVSRYRPYFIRDAKNMATTQVGLALQASPFLHEQLQATDGNLWWQARDVAWSRNGGLNVTVNGTSLLLDATGQPLTTIKATFDRASGNLVYTSLPSIQVAGQTVVVNAMYVDLARGRVRFSFSPQVPNAIGLTVYATMNPQARRITTDSRADSGPIAFIDTAQKPNEANSAGAALGTVETDRYWYIWRKSGSTGTSTSPTLYYKTQRLTVDLLLRDANGQPLSIQLVNKGSATAPDYRPNVTVTLGGTKLYDPANAPGANVVDVDWVRGRIYFPIFNGTTAMEGQLVTITGTDKNGNPIGAATGNQIVDNVHWMDEPRYNESPSPTIATSTPVPGRVAITATATGDAALPIDTIINESNVTAFLDPKQAHKVWLFWNSTRNGTADIYYETISPLFSAAPGG